MASLQWEAIEPKPEISNRSSPLALGEALEHIFHDMGGGLWLAGGTALAGFYAEHRRSDDLDLFATDLTTFKSATLAIHALKERGASFSNERRTPNYFHAELDYENHTFTTDVVLDENLHRVGKAFRVKHGIWVADLPTLFASKAACLISRCSEKDLFDLDWIFSKMGRISVDEIIKRGSLIDGGITVETLLISLRGAILRQEACHFLLPASSLTPEKAYRKIGDLRQRLIQSLMEYEKKLPLDEDVKILSEAMKSRKQDDDPKV